MKRTIALLLALVIVVGIISYVPVTAQAAEVNSGKCGENLTWTLDGDGVLTISGSGAMDDYNTNAPWCDYRDVITHVIISDGVTSIGGRAFHRCEKMRNIAIPNSVTVIGEGAFAYCYALEEIDLPDGLTSIEYNTFSDCSSLKEIVIPDGVTDIGLNAFYRCSELESVVLPENLISFDGAPFYACYKLTEITIPANVTTMGFRMFPYCNSLTKITFMGDAPFIESDTFDGVTATVYYPAGNATWTVDVMQNYGGTITWTAYGNPGPVITQQPTNAEAALGENYCVTVEAEGEGLKYQWYFRNAGSSVWYKSSVRDNTYDDVMTKARAGREVYCVITDANGNKVTTNIVKLIRVAKEELQIVTQPVSDEAALGDTYSVTVAAKGEGLKYQWYFRNEGSNIWYRSSVRTDTYTNVMTKARAGREIYCVITDALGNTVTTDVVKLVRVLKEELQIVTQPANATAALGDNYCVTVEAKGEGLKYQWYFRNAGSDKWYKSSVRDNTYDDVMTTARAGREVYCVITDAFGNTVTTDIATLIRIPKYALQINTQPTDNYVEMGQNYVVRVYAQGEGLSYQWYFRNEGSSTWYKSSVTSSIYKNTMTPARANREVYCVITDALGNTVKTNIAKLVLIRSADGHISKENAEILITACDKLLAKLAQDSVLNCLLEAERTRLRTDRDRLVVEVNYVFIETEWNDGSFTQKTLKQVYEETLTHYSALKKLLGY